MAVIASLREAIPSQNLRLLRAGSRPTALATLAPALFAKQIEVQV